jgi:protoporphyrinogen oxidase
MKKQVYILGGGISGLTLAVQFLRRFGNKCSVTVIEGSENIGGIAGSFHVDGLTFDYGSHRIHPATPAHIFSDIKAYLGNDLLERPRNGRIRLLETYIPFPLRPAEMLRNLPYRFTAGFIFDLLKKALGSKQIAPSNFADALRQDLGNTICENFYFPFARKLWGVEPSEIAPVQARRRVAAQGMVALIKKRFAIPIRQRIFFITRAKGSVNC